MSRRSSEQHDPLPHEVRQGAPSSGSNLSAAESPQSEATTPSSPPEPVSSKRLKAYPIQALGRELQGPSDARRHADSSALNGDSVAPFILSQLIGHYAAVGGAAARLVVVEQMNLMGLGTNHLTAADLPVLAIALASQLGTSRARHQFYSSVRSLHPTLARL